MIVDFHTHVFPPNIKSERQKYAAKDACFASLYSSPKAELITAQELISSMDEGQIDISVILNYGWATQELCHETNDYILDSIARYPKRLVGFCAVQPNSAEARSELERCVEAGVRGIGELRPDMQSFGLADDRVMAPLIDVIRKHGLIISSHASEPVGHIYPGKGNITPQLLYPFLSKYPDLPVVLAHWGGGLPLYGLMPEVKKAFENVFFDTAASPFLYSPQIYRHVAEIVGAEHILFGTDFPLMKPGRVLAEIETINLTPRTKEAILSGNALKLLGIRHESRI